MSDRLIHELSEALSELLHYSENRHRMGRGHEYMDGAKIEAKARAAIAKAKEAA